MKSKKFVVTEEWDKNHGKEGYISSTSELLEAVLSCEKLETLEELKFGNWGEAYESDGCQDIINMIVENSAKFQHIKSIFIGDMGYEECEISWIIQGDYSKIWEALPNLEKLTIKGANNLSLGDIKHNNLKHLEIISGGLSVSVLESIENAELPALEKLMLYLGVDEYGFDGSIKTIETLVEKAKKFKNLKYLGLVNSEMQNEIVKVVMDSDIVKQLEVLDFSYGTLIDIGVRYILKREEKISHLKELKLNRGYFSQKLCDELKNMKVKVSLDDVQIIELSDEEINNYYLNSKYDWDKKFYEKLLKDKNITKIEVENKDIDEIDSEILTGVLRDSLDVYPLYTE